MEYIVLDIETTGLSRYIHKITEIAAVKVKDNKIIEEYQTLVNPETKIPRFITRLTGIDNEMVKDAPTINEVMPGLLKFLGNHTIVAHNATFDYGFIAYNAEMYLKKRICNDKLCTRKLANRLLPDIPSKKLSALCELFKVTNEQAHRAMADVKATTQIFSKMQELLQYAEITDLEKIKEFEKTRPKDVPREISHTFSRVLF